jgi:Bacterial regulatory proteins, gntR family
MLSNQRVQFRFAQLVHDRKRRGKPLDLSLSPEQAEAVSAIAQSQPTAGNTCRLPGKKGQVTRAMSVIEGDGGGLAAVPAAPGDGVSPEGVSDGRGLAAVLPMDGSQVMQDDGDDRLDEDDPRPLWQQLAELLRGRIERGELAGRLEAETALAQRYGVSRDTVRRALADLARDGLIRSTRGRGTFVLPPGERGT